MLNMNKNNLEFMVGAVSAIWFEEWLLHHTYAADLLESATRAGLNADFYSAFCEILLDWLDFWDVQIDQSNLVTAICKEWGDIATRSDSASGSEVDCNIESRVQNEGNEVATVNIAGMDIDYWLDDSPMSDPYITHDAPVANEELMRLLQG